MKSTETSPSAHVLRKSQPEEFDLVILGGGTGSPIAAWTLGGAGKQVAGGGRKKIAGAAPARPSLRGLLPAKESKSQSSSANTSADRSHFLSRWSMPSSVTSQR